MQTLVEHDSSCCYGRKSEQNQPVVEWPSPFKDRGGTLSDSPAPVSAPVSPKIIGYFSLTQPYKSTLRLVLPPLLLLFFSVGNCSHERTKFPKTESPPQIMTYLIYQDHEASAKSRNFTC